MAAGEKSDTDGRAVTYCLVPRDLAPRLHELLRRHFRDEQSVVVVVEQRGSDRRSGAERRGPEAPAPAVERRKIRVRGGRRAGEQRAALVPVEAPELPRRARAHADRLRFVERLEPSTQHLEDLDTDRLVTRIQAGDKEAFAQLYMRYFDQVYGYLRHLFKDSHQAEDAAQQVFMKVFEGVHSYEQRGGPFRGWLFTVARNRALNELARAGRVQPAELEKLASHGASPSEPEPDEISALDWISDRELHLFIERLPLAQRQVLFLRYLVGLRMSEVATVLETSPAAVRQQHTRALRFLRTRLTAVGRHGERRGGRIGTRVLIRKTPVVRARRFSLMV